MKWLSLLALIACGDNLPAPVTAEPTSGSRLHLPLVRYEDGTHQLATTDSLLDAARNEPCVIRQWSDGLRYCTPEAYRTVFLDEQCTTEIARRRSVEPERPYALHEFVVAGDPLPSRLYHLGAEIPRAQVTAAFEFRDNLCVPRTDNADQDRFFELADEIDRGELVHITRVQVPIDDRLSALVDASADGLQRPTALFDREQQHTCQLKWRDDATLTCDLDVDTSNQFADRDCTVPAVTVNAASAPPDLTRRNHGIECDTFHEPTDVVLAQTSFVKSGDECIETPLNLGDRVFALGPAIELATIARTRLDDGRRLQVIEVGDTHFPEPAVFDTELQQECSPATLNGNVLQCLPTFVAQRTMFSDPTCQTQVAAVEVVEQCGVRPPAFARTEMRRLAPILEAAQVYERSTAKMCAPAIPVFGGTFHRVGESLVSSGFVRAKTEFE